MHVQLKESCNSWNQAGESVEFADVLENLFSSSALVLYYKSFNLIFVVLISFWTWILFDMIGDVYSREIAVLSLGLFYLGLFVIWKLDEITEKFRAAWGESINVTVTDDADNIMHSNTSRKEIELNSNVAEKKV